jgi:uncharacterized protein YcsI (UPF0317 family)
MHKFKMFLIGCSYGLVFGLIDNGFLFAGMDALDNYLIYNGYNAMTAAGFGNTLSDGIGALAGGLVAAILYKLFKIQEDKISILQQFTGIVIGCLIPVGIQMVLI